jgi:DNA polymerase-1
VSRKKAVYLVDGSAQIHRAYFAVRGLATTRGLPTGAVFGFAATLRKLVEDEDPEYLAVVFDPPGPTFRHEQYAEYKAHRPKMDDDLVVQLPFVRRVCDAFRVPAIEVPGYEADDVLATLARQAVEAGLDAVVVTGDKDLLQIVSNRIVVLNPGREGTGSTVYDRKVVEQKFGVPPESVVDVLALVGDAVDNVPGVPGIGDKGARELVREFGSLDAVLANAAQVKRKAYREGLIAHREQALLSRSLVTLRTDAPVRLDLDGLRRREADRGAAHDLFKELEFASLAKAYAPEAEVVRAATEHAVVRDQATLTAALERAERAGRVAVSLLLTAKEPMRAEIAGVSLALEAGRSVYVPLGPRPLGEGGGVPPAEALSQLRLLLEAPSLAKLGANLKRDRVALARRGVRLEGLAFDALLAAYLLNPGRRGYAMEDVVSDQLGATLAAPEAPPGGVVADAPWEWAAGVAGREAEAVLRLEEPMRRRLEAEGLLSVYATLELPLASVLADMEEAGVRVDAARLAAMSREMETQIGELTKQIHALAKGEFNINSPAQLREVLFERLGLRSGKKTAKTRAASTAEDVLEELALVHELPQRILEYRAVQKLKSTYVDSLPQMIHPQTGRIHATHNQTVAATGRLSSTDPNLQNIPIRTAEGRKIREAFVADPGHLLLSADYSQIELRILAHLSKDQTLLDTFRRGEDIHDRTSQEIFGPLSPLPPEEQRRRSKMVNYALLYGKTAFTLARDLGVSRREAERFIDSYFSRYPSVRRFLDSTVATARETGVVRTLLGRLRRLPELGSSNFQVRTEAERQAVNTPIQGSAADLIKKAMLDLAAALRHRGLGARLILQIHDELLLEVPEQEGEEALALVKQVMENALELDVPLVVDARLGRNWAEAH